jgi:hypothetical protein
MALLFSNNAVTTLAAGATAGATTLTVTDGSLFNTPTGGNTERLTLERADGSAREIVTMTTRSGNTLTVQRAQEGTTALAWTAGDRVEGRVTKGVLDNFAQLSADPVKIGAGASAPAIQTTALGAYASAASAGSTAIGYAANASAAKCVAIGYGTLTAGGENAVAVGYNAAATNNAIAIGADAKASIASTVQMQGALIARRDSGEDANEAVKHFSTAEVVLLTKEVDTNITGSHTIPLPQNCQFFVNEVGLMITVSIGMTAPAHVSFGDNSSATAYLGVTAATKTNAGGRDRWSALSKIDGEGQTLRFTVNTAATTSSTARGRAYFKGILVENE